jgi:Na+/H+-dicarboxylate symporter
MRPTTRVLLALIVGFMVGGAIRLANIPVLVTAASFIEPIGPMWVNAIRMTVVPLVVSLLVVGVATANDAKAIGRLGWRAVLLYTALLTLGGVIAALIAPSVFDRLSIDPAVAATMGQQATQPQTMPAMPSVAQRIIEIVPTNPVKAAVDGAMLPLIVFTLALSLGALRLTPAMREPLVRLCSAVADALMVVVRWILWLAPAGIFALALTLAVRTGLSVAGALAYYIVTHIVLLLLLLAALYPIVAIGGRVGIRQFASAVAPAQAVAISSRSSIAALPALFSAAREKLGLPTQVVSFALPLAVSTLRLNVPVTWVVTVLFLGKLYGVPIEAGAIASLVVTATLISFSVPGIPSASLFLLAPVLVQMGLPAEGVGIMIAVDAIPDMFKTLTNVTSHLATTAVLARHSAVVEAQDSALPEAEAAATLSGAP